MLGHTLPPSLLTFSHLLSTPCLEPDSCVVYLREAGTWHKEEAPVDSVLRLPMDSFDQPPGDDRQVIISLSLSILFPFYLFLYSVFSLFYTLSPIQLNSKGFIGMGNICLKE